MNEPLLIGITGAIGSGKTSVADHLVKAQSFKSFGFADTLKDVILDTLGLEPHTCYGTQAEKSAPIEALGSVPPVFAAFGPPWDQRVGGPWCGRWLLEFIGTDVFRAISPNVWVDHAIRRVKAEREVYALHENDEAGAFGGCIRHVVADVRFPNEVDAIKAAGGQVWEVICTDREAETTGHVSDSPWLKIAIEPDAILKAPHGRLDLLFNRADYLVDALKLRLPEFTGRTD